MALGPTFFRQNVDGVPLAPLRAPSLVIDYNAAEEGSVYFTVPAGAASVELQLGDVTNPSIEQVTVSLNLDGE